MKHLMKFDMPEDQTELLLAQRGSKFYCNLWEIDQFIRNKLKYEEVNKDVREALEEVRALVDHNLFEDIP